MLFFALRIYTLNFLYMAITDKKSLIEYMGQFLTDERKSRFNDILPHRTRHITIVLENIFQPQNASAVLRTCDCLGVQDVHIIENGNKYNVNPSVALGSNKWLSMHYYNEASNNTAQCIELLKKRGYKIVCTSPHNNSCALEDLDISTKTALFLVQRCMGFLKL